MLFLQSFGTIGAALGSLTAWPLSETLGRKAVLMAVGFPAFAGWLIIVFSAYVVDNLSGFVAMLLVGRLLSGSAAGLSAGAVAVSLYHSLTNNFKFLLFYVLFTLYLTVL